MIVTDSTFDETIKQNKLVLIDFWADWFGPCKKVSPILDEISSEFNLPVGKLNIDENQVKPQEYGVSSIPTMVLFEDGIQIKTIVGAMPKHQMIKELSDWI